MTKKELEIRLAIAENIIKESIHLLSDENIRLQQHLHKCDYVKANYWADAQARVALKKYEKRVDVFKCYGKDYYEFVQNTEPTEADLPFHDTVIDLEESETDKIDLDKDIQVVKNFSDEDLAYLWGNEPFNEVETRSDIPEGATYLGWLNKIGVGYIQLFRYRSAYYSYIL